MMLICDGFVAFYLVLIFVHWIYCNLLTMFKSPNFSNISLGLFKLLLFNLFFNVQFYLILILSCGFYLLYCYATFLFIFRLFFTLLYKWCSLYNRFKFPIILYVCKPNFYFCCVLKLISFALLSPVFHVQAS